MYRGDTDVVAGVWGLRPPTAKFDHFGVAGFTDVGAYYELFRREHVAIKK